MPTSQFDAEAYRQQLRQRTLDRMLGANKPPVAPQFADNLGTAPARPSSSMGGGLDAAAAPAASPVSTLGADAPAPAGGLDSMGGAAPGQGQDAAQIDAMPPDFNPKVKNPESIKTMGDLIDSMDSKSVKTYLNWWEQKYGSINSKWDAIEGHLGQRPDPSRKLSRQDKFKMLTEFGLSLIRNSGSQGLTKAVTGAVGDTVRTAQAQRTLEGQQYDQNLGLARQGRAADLKEVGGLGDALKTSSEITENESTTAKNKRDAKRTPHILYGKDDTAIDYDSDTGMSRQINGVDGKPFKAQPMGARGGLAHDSRPAEQKRYDHLLSIGVDKKVALKLAYRQKSGDPRKDYKDVVTAVARATYGDMDAATEAAQMFIATAYPDGTDIKEDASILPDDDDPMGLGIKPKK